MIETSAYYGFLLLPTPALQLSFDSYRVFNSVEALRKNQLDRSTELGESSVSAGVVLVHSLLKAASCCSNVVAAVTAAKDVNKGRHRVSESFIRHPSTGSG